MSYIELYMTTAGTKTIEEGLTSLYGTSGKELMSSASTIIKFDEVLLKVEDELSFVHEGT